MSCTRPMRAWYSNTVSEETGKRQITFTRANALVDKEIMVPCGKCMSCRIKHSGAWALRCMHEAQIYEKNCFITLTYDDEHLPDELIHDHFVRFMKRFRRSIEPVKIRYFMCGEYGEKFGRPHFHAIIFNYDFDDKVEFKLGKKSILYTSAELSKLWPFGHSTIGAVTYESAAYCARYATKTKRSLNSYDKEDRRSEYIAMSRKPGIGSRYFEKYHDELYQHDSVVYNSRSFALPRFYTNRFSEEQQRELKIKRAMRIDKRESTEERSRVREKVLDSKLKFYNRGSLNE